MSKPVVAHAHAGDDKNQQQDSFGGLHVRMITCHSSAMQHFFAWIFLLAQAGAEPVKGVAFEKAEFAFSAGYSETAMEFDLPFTNHTAQSVKVLAVETSCSCMKVSVAERQVEPGATGSVHCVVRVPDVTGPIQKIVILNTDAPGGGMHVTRVRVEVPTVFTLTPGRLVWPVGAAADEKVLRIQVDEVAAPVNVTKVACPGDLFEWTLKTIRDGHEFELRIRPKTTQKSTLGFFQLQTDSPVERHKKHGFQAVVEAVASPPR